MLLIWVLPAPGSPWRTLLSSWTMKTLFAWWTAPPSSARCLSITISRSRVDRQTILLSPCLSRVSLWQMPKLRKRSWSRRLLRWRCSVSICSVILWLLTRSSYKAVQRFQGDIYSAFSWTLVFWFSLWPPPPLHRLYILSNLLPSNWKKKWLKIFLFQWSFVDLNYS